MILNDFYLLLLCRKVTLRKISIVQFHKACPHKIEQLNFYLRMALLAVHESALLRLDQRYLHISFILIH